MGESTSNEGSATTDGNALPNRDPPDVTRFKAAAAKRVQAHRWRRRLRSLLRLGFRTTLHERIDCPSQHTFPQDLMEVTAEPAAGGGTVRFPPGAQPPQ